MKITRNLSYRAVSWGRKWNAPTITPKEVSDYANVSYQLIDINRIDISQLGGTDDIKSILYIFQNIRQFSNLEKVRKLIQQLVKFSFFKDKKSDLQNDIKKILLLYIASSIPIEKKDAILKIFSEETEKKGLGGNMKSMLDAFKEEGIQEGMQRGVQKGREEGREKWMQRGIQRGMQRGMLKGKEEGIQRGMQKGMLQTALKMKQKGLTSELIQEVTGLSTDKIEKL